MIALLLAACAPPPAESRVVVAYGARGEGEIEPCGCPKRPLGGLARRNGVLARERAAGSLVVVDAGQSLGVPPEEAVGAVEQRRIKAEAVAHAFALGRIDAIALGRDDWALGSAFVRELVDREHLPVLAANLRCAGSAPYPGGKVVEVAGKRVGVVGVTDGVVDGCEVGPAQPALVDAVAALGPVDVVLGLFPYSTDRELFAALVGSVPVDVGVDARGRAARAGAEPLRGEGATWLAGAGAEMHSVSRLTLRFLAGGAGWIPDGEAARVEDRLGAARRHVDELGPRIDAATEADRALLVRQRDAYVRQIEALTRRAEFAAGGVHHVLALDEIELDDTAPEDPATAASVAEAKRAIAAAAGGAGAAAFVARRVLDESSPYAGGEACVPCHTAQHAQWSTTAHARAWQSLVGKERALDDQCWGCHVTGHAAEGGPPSAAASGPFRDVQCEACHGAGRSHALSPEDHPLAVDPAVEVCVRCHDGEQDQGRFDFAAYRPGIAH